MSLLDEAMGNEEFEATESVGGVTTEPQQPQFRLTDFLPNIDFILAETGEGNIENYIQHPLNFKSSKGIAQMLRGFTGICGSLNYAIIDITLGAFEIMREGREQHETTDRTE
ncbi:MAG: hypothetical protein ACK5MV_05185 [Aminipila sp.]